MKLFTLILYTCYWVALSYGAAAAGSPNAGALLGATGAVIMYRAFEFYLQDLRDTRAVKDRTYEMITFAMIDGIDILSGLSDDDIDELSYLLHHDVREFELRFRALIHAAVLRHEAEIALHSDDEWDGDVWYDDLNDELGVNDDSE